MKKIITYLLATTLIASAAQATDCANGAGVEVIGKKNNQTYCRSKVLVNWYTAFAWCKSQNMHLVTWEEACPGSKRGEICTNLVGTGDYGECAWTIHPWLPDTAISVFLSNGTLYDGYRNDTARGYKKLTALCE